MIVSVERVQEGMSYKVRVGMFEMTLGVGPLWSLFWDAWIPSGAYQTVSPYESYDLYCRYDNVEQSMTLYIKQHNDTEVRKYFQITDKQLIQGFNMLNQDEGSFKKFHRIAFRRIET